MSGYIVHSAKGTSWKKKDHKYLRKENGRYFYTDKNGNSRTLRNDKSSDIYDENGKLDLKKFPQDTRSFHLGTHGLISRDQRLVARKTQNTLNEKELKKYQSKLKKEIKVSNSRTLSKDLQKIKEVTTSFTTPFTDKIIKKGKDFMFYLFN